MVHVAMIRLPVLMGACALLCGCRGGGGGQALPASPRVGQSVVSSPATVAESVQSNQNGSSFVSPNSRRAAHAHGAEMRRAFKLQNNQAQPTQPVQ